MSILFFVLALGLLAYLWLSKKTAKASDGSTCIKVNRSRFKSHWDDNAVPSGDIRKIADKHLSSGDPSLNGSIVGGFFKAIDTYPSEGAGNYYKKQIQQWAANQGLPYWNTVRGELLCQS